MTLGKFVVGLILLIVGIVFAIVSSRATAYDSGLPEREKNIKTILKENKKTIYGVLSAFFLIPSAILIISSVMMYRKKKRNRANWEAESSHAKAERSRTRNVPLHYQQGRLPALSQEEQELQDMKKFPFQER